LEADAVALCGLLGDGIAEDAPAWSRPLTAIVDTMVSP
jgi:hypothetical protein